MTDPHGRQPIGVNQPAGGGTNYPLVQPSADIQYLLADFYLSYRDDTCEYKLPFSIGWLFGFGTSDNNESVPEGYPESTHEYDLGIVDADGRVVLSTADMDSFYVRDWGGRLKIMQWMGDDNVCRCTIHTKWTSQDIAQGLSREYDNFIAPERSELDSRTVNKLPRRLRKLRVGVSNITGKVTFVSGYNVDVLEATAATDVVPLMMFETPETSERKVIPGTRKSTMVHFAAGSGLGLGRVPGCDEEDTPLKLINSASPNDAGNLTLDMSQCLRVQRPVSLVRQSPRQLQYAAPGLTSEEAAASLEMHNDCGPCCECSFYVRTYKGLSRQWDLGNDLAQRLVSVRNTLERNIARWDATRACRVLRSLRAVLIPEADCKVSAGGLYCNINKCCVAPLVLRFTFEYYSNGVPSEAAGVVCSKVSITGAGSPPEGLSGALAGEWPVYEVLFDYANPSDTSSGGFRLCLSGCTPDNNLGMIVTAHYPEMEPTYEDTPCEAPVVVPSSALMAKWAASTLGLPAYPTRALVETPLIPLNNANAYCDSCNCERGVTEISESL